MKRAFVNAQLKRSKDGLIGYEYLDFKVLQPAELN